MSSVTQNAVKYFRAIERVIIMWTGIRPNACRILKSFVFLGIIGIFTYQQAMWIIDSGRLVFAREQIDTFDILRRRAEELNDPEQVNQLIIAIKEYYPSGTKQARGSHLDIIVESVRRLMSECTEKRYHELVRANGSKASRQ